MSAPYVRHEWVDEARLLPGAVEHVDATLLDFAWDQTAGLLAVEPRLVALAELVVGCARAGGVPDAMWAGVDSIAALLVGPTRAAGQTTPVNATSIAVSSTLSGETTRQRYVAALRRRAEQEAA